MFELKEPSVLSISRASISFFWLKDLVGFFNILHKPGVFFIHSRKTSWSVGSHVCKHFSFRPLFHTIWNSGHRSQTQNRRANFSPEIKNKDLCDDGCAEMFIIILKLSPPYCSMTAGGRSDNVCLVYYMYQVLRVSHLKTSTWPSFCKLCLPYFFLILWQMQSKYSDRTSHHDNTLSIMTVLLRSISLHFYCCSKITGGQNNLFETHSDKKQQILVWVFFEIAFDPPPF